MVTEKNNHSLNELSFQQYLTFRFSEEQAFEKKFLLSVRRQILSGSMEVRGLFFEARPGNGEGKTAIIRRLVEGAPLTVVGLFNPEIPCVQCESYEKLHDFVLEKDNFIVLLQWKYLHAHKELQESSYKKVHDLVVAAREKNALVIFEDFNLPCSERYDESFVFSSLFKSKIMIDSPLPELYKLHAMSRQGLMLDKSVTEYLFRHTGGVSLGDFHACLDILKSIGEQVTSEHVKRTIFLLGYAESFDDEVEGLQSLKGRDSLKGELLKIEAFRKTLKDIRGIIKVPSYLFVGPPGTGKTFSVRCLSKEMGLPVFHVDSEKLTRGDHSLPVGIKKVFKGLLNGPPSIIFVDEAEKLLGKSDITGTDGAVQGEFQQIIDGVYTHEFKGIIILSANSAYPFSQPLLDRFQIITFDLPSRQDRFEFLTYKAGLLEPELRTLVLEDSSIEDLVQEIGEKSYREIDRRWTDLVLSKLTEGLTVKAAIERRKEREVYYVG